MAKLLDQFGREIETGTTPTRRQVAALAIRDRWSSYPSKNLTPQKLSQIFLAADGGDVYRQSELFTEMEEKDTHLFSQLQTRKNAVLGLDYHIVPADTDAESVRIADFVTDVISGLQDFEDMLMDLLDAVGKGFAMSEMLWEADEGRDVISGFNALPQKRAVFTEYGKSPWATDFQAPKITTEANPSQGEDLPPFKMIYHRYKARSGYDTRAGVLRVCSWMYLFKNYGIKDWMAFLEIFGVPFRLGKYDPSAEQADKDALALAIQSLGSDAAGIISKNTEIEFIEASGSSTRNSPFEGLANFCDAQISKAILGQTLTTQEGSSGSFSLGQVHDLVRHDLIKADAKALGKTVRYQVIRPLVAYNFGWDKALPDFVLKFEPPEDLKVLSEVYKNLSGINYPMTAEHISERFKIPMPKTGDTVLPSMSAARAPGMFKHVLKSTPDSIIASQQTRVDGLIALTAEEGTEALTGLLDPVERLVMNATSLEEIRNGLNAMYQGMDGEEFEELMAKAMFAAGMYGRAAGGDQP